MTVRTSPIPFECGAASAARTQLSLAVVLMALVTWLSLPRTRDHGTRGRG